MLLLSHINSHIIYSFSTFSFIFKFFVHFNLPTYCYTFSNFSPPFYPFISLLLSTLISLFLNSFIFFYFWFFLFPSFYYKFTIFYHILYIIFSHTKGYFSPFLFVKFFFFHFLVDIKFYFLLHHYFRLMNFCIIWNSTLG